MPNTSEPRERLHPSWIFRPSVAKPATPLCISVAKTAFCSQAVISLIATTVIMDREAETFACA